MGCFSSKPDEADAGASAVKMGYVPGNTDGGTAYAGHSGGHHTSGGDGGGGGGDGGGGGG